MPAALMKSACTLGFLLYAIVVGIDAKSQTPMQPVCNVFAGRITIMQHLKRHQVAAAALPGYQLQYKPPPPQVLERMSPSPQPCQLEQQQEGSSNGAINSVSVSTECGQAPDNNSWAAPQYLQSYHTSQTSERSMHHMSPVSYAPVAAKLHYVAPRWTWPSPQVAGSRGSGQAKSAHQQQPLSWHISQELYQQQQQNYWQYSLTRPQNGHVCAWGGQHLDLEDPNCRQHQQLYHTDPVQLFESASLEAAVQESLIAAAAASVGAAIPDEQDRPQSAFARDTRSYSAGEHTRANIQHSRSRRLECGHAQEQYCSWSWCYFAVR